MIIHLNVPYSEKDEAKALGARWNPSRKTWFIEDREDLTPFMKWIPAPLLRPHKKRLHPRFENNSIRRPV